MGHQATNAGSEFAFRGERAPAHFNMARYCLGDAARRFPNKPGLIVFDEPSCARPSEVWSFKELDNAVLSIASALRDRDLAPGARIMIRLENTSLYALMYFGAIAGGFVPLPTSSQLTGEEATFLADDSGAQAVALCDKLAMGKAPAGVDIITESEARAMLASPIRTSYADTACNDPAFLIYTSGTTAYPKGVLHAQRAAWGRRPMYDGWYGITSDDRMAHAGAFNWTFTLGTGLADPWANGATAIIYTGEKDPGVWPRLVCEAKATMLAGVPGLFRQILKYACPSRRDLASLRHGLIAGDTPPPGLFDDWRGVTGCELYEALGMSEISTYISCAPNVPRRDGAVGRAQPGRSVAVLNEDGGTQPLAPGDRGLLCVHRSDPGMMLGYWKRADEEADVLRGDWFVGGDLATIDEDGYITHHGRANDIIKALGYRVSPQEVEAVLQRHKDVLEVACTGHEVKAGVSVVAAFVVVKQDRRPQADALIAYTARHLADYKRPRAIFFVDALPRTANGKVRRSELGRKSG